MEDTLGVMLTIREILSKEGVLILVLMEDTLGVIAGVALLRASHGLNPCFNGRYSRRLRLIFLCLSLFEVYLLLAERFS